MHPLDDRIAVSISEAARLVHRSTWTIQREISAGRLKAYRSHPKADPRILVEDLRKWVKGECIAGGDHAA